MKTKCFNAWVLSALLVVFTVFPQKPAQAFIPFIGIGIAAYGSGGTLLSANLLSSVATALLGGSIVALAITPTPLANGEALPSYALPIRIPTTTSAPVTAAVFPPPPAPATVTPLTQAGYRFGTSTGPTSAIYTTPYSYCQAALAASGLAGSGGFCLEVHPLYPSAPDGSSLTCALNSTKACRVAYPGNPTKWFDFMYYTAPSCSGGYSASGSECTLSNPSAVTADAKVDMQRGSTAYSTADKDAPISSNSRVSAGKVEAWGNDANGNPVVVTAGVDANGHSTLGVQKQTKSQDGQTLIKSDNYVINKDTGLVTSVASGTRTGSIAINADTSVPTVSTGSAVQAIPGVEAGAVPGTGTGTGTGTGEPIAFPSDYARAGEAANAATQVKTSVDAITTKLTDTQTVDDPTIPDYPDVWASTFDGITGWHLPSHTSECPTGSFVFNNQIFTIDAHCQLISNYFGALSAAMNVVWFVLAFAVVMGA